MDDLFECRVSLQYVRNLIRVLSPLTPQVAEVINDSLRHVREATPLLRQKMSQFPVLAGTETPERLEELAGLLEGWIRDLGKVSPSPLQRNLEALGAAVGLDGLEVEILGLAVRSEEIPAVQILCSGLKDQCELSAPRMLAALLEARWRDVHLRLEPDSGLIRTGLIRLVPFCRRSSFGIGLSISPAVSRAVLYPAGGFSDLLTRLFGESRYPQLQWEDYEHIGAERDLAARLIEGALESRARRVHVLLYGPTGTGKTEFCKVVAHRLGAELYSAGEKSEGEEEFDRSGRLGAFQLAQRLLHRPKAVLLFDEMEDLFEEGLEVHPSLLGASLLPRRSGAGSKVFLHRLLEDTPVPTFWTTNSLFALGPAVVRRMSLAIELKSPPRKVRERVWRRHLEEQDLEVPGEEVLALARDVEAPPGVVAKAVQASKLSGGDPEGLRLAVTGLAKALRGRTPRLPRVSKEVVFDPSLLNPDADLTALLRGLEGQKGRAFSLCLYGPPGTGKSAFVRHLAERMGLEVLQKRASDLLSMWVGEAEKNIARAFEEAREEGAFLVFDEADSLLRDRGLALRSWEVTQVNEMLTWMESHDHPFACTTNLLDRLDPASLRRFTFKIRLGFLKSPQARGAYKLYFGMEAPQQLDSLRTLTPGDFAAVQRQAEVLGPGRDGDALVRMLTLECELKPEGGRVIGFA